MLTITADDAGVRAHLQALQGRMNNLKPVMAGIGQALESRVRQSFETRTDPMGNAWAPWSPDTAKSYPRRGSRAAAKAGRSGHGQLLDRYRAAIPATRLSPQTYWHHAQTICKARS